MVVCGSYVIADVISAVAASGSEWRRVRAAQAATQPNYFHTPAGSNTLPFCSVRVCTCGEVTSQNLWSLYDSGAARILQQGASEVWAYRGSRVRSPPVPVVLSVYQRGCLLDSLAMYLSCDTKKFHDNESTHILHNFWTSTHRGKLPPFPPLAAPLLYDRHVVGITWHDAWS